MSETDYYQKSLCRPCGCSYGAIPDKTLPHREGCWIHKKGLISSQNNTLKMTNKHRTEHLNQLAKELKCEIKYIGHRSGMMYVEFGYIETPTVKDQIDYLIGLHELGHVYHGHTQARPPHSDKRFYFDNGVLRSEAQAWEFALDNCKEKLDNETRRFAWEVCLGSYYSHAVELMGTPTRLWNGNRHHVEFVFDKIDDYFIGVAKRIVENCGITLPF